MKKSWSEIWKEEVRRCGRDRHGTEVEGRKMRWYGHVVRLITESWWTHHGMKHGRHCREGEVGEVVMI